ncbi:MAG: polysaccharide deacetylase family protein [Alphaproteobacteria bacterium]|nr:polysaccharide deacetylase family protein [Alphaproteobacteria bacterium]
MTQRGTQSAGGTEKLLIVNCDDLGSSHAANVAILACLNRGIATSATLMVPCPWAFEGAQMTKGLDIGIHLTLTCEYPAYRWRPLSGGASLRDKDGFMPATVSEVYARADLGEVEAECRAQIEAALGWGVDITHLDAHMGTMQIHPAYFEIYLRLATDYRLPLRMVGEDADAALGYRPRQKARAAGIAFADHFVMPVWGEPTLPQFRAHLTRLRPGISEIFAHPVEDGAELRSYDPRDADVRAGDYVTLTDTKLAQIIAEEKIERISFRPLRERMRQDTRQG